LRALSWLGLRRRQDWALGLDLALTNLRIFRLREGLEELALALENAGKQGQEDRFFQRLKVLDPSGLARRQLMAGLAAAGGRQG